MVEHLNDFGYNDIEIISSPYVRAMQTAAATARALGHQYIKLDYTLSEWMKDEFFDSNPIDHLLVRSGRNKGDNSEQIARLEQKYLNGIKIMDPTNEEHAAMLNLT